MVHKIWINNHAFSEINVKFLKNSPGESYLCEIHQAAACLFACGCPCSLGFQALNSLSLIYGTDPITIVNYKVKTDVHLYVLYNGVSRVQTRNWVFILRVIAFVGFSILMSVSQLSEFSSSAEYIRDCQVCDRLLDFIISTLHTILYKKMGKESGTRFPFW